MAKRILVASALAALSLGAQGCVSADLYNKKTTECEGYKAAYMGADAAVANKQKEIDAAKARIAQLERDVANANQRAAHADTVVDAKFKSMKEQYERMIEELGKEQGSEFTINKSTGGVVLEESVYFAPGKAELKQEKFPALDGLIGKLKSGDLAGAAIEVAGHTDSDPIQRSGWKDNYQLSAERARAVLAYFQKKGVDAERLFIAGYGATRPRTEKKAENRRVEIVLHERS